MRTSLQSILRHALPALATAAAISGSAHAAMLYQQAPVDGGESYFAQYSIAEGTGYQNADSFTLGAASTITGIRWWGTGANDSGLFVVRLFPDLLILSDSFDVLAGSVLRSGTSSIKDTAGNDIYEYELTLTTPVDVLPGTRHISVFFDSMDNWAWIEGTGPDGESAFRGQDGVPWGILPPDLAFAVLGNRLPPPVPEPGLLALLAAGGMAAFAARRVAARRAVTQRRP